MSCPSDAMFDQPMPAVSISCVHRLIADAIRAAKTDAERDAYVAFERQVHAIVARHDLRPTHRVAAWRLLQHLRAD